MAIQVKQVTIWRTEVEDRPGQLARTLEPLASAGASLDVVMGYRFPGHERSAIEVYPVTGKKIAAAAGAADLAPAAIPALRVRGDDLPGLGHGIAEALGAGGFNINFLVAQVVDGRYSAVFGFSEGTDLGQAASVIRRAGAVHARSAAPARRRRAGPPRRQALPRAARGTRGGRKK